MERGTNNADILQYGEFSSKQVFFIQRWLELLNVNTHSRYSVKYLNSHQALKEVLHVCKGMINDEIKSNDYHLKLVFEEASHIIQRDELLKTEAGSYLKIMKNSLMGAPKASQTPKLHSTIYQLGYVTRYLEANYLDWIVKHLKQKLLSDSEESADTHAQFQEIEILMLALVSELIGEGWSIKKLYELVREEILQKRVKEIESWEKFFNVILKRKSNYICFFYFDFPPKKLLQDKITQFKIDLLDGDSVLTTYSDNALKSHISPKKTYIRVITEAYDVHSAINLAWRELTEKIDILRFYGYSSPNINKKPIVLEPDGMHFTRNVSVSLMSNKKKYRAPDSIVETIWRQTQGRGNRGINRKIQSLFEFSRISEESLAPQSTFLNLWIGLESFVQTKEKDGGIENVKMVVSTTSSHNYIYSLVKNFLEDCNRCQVEINEDGEETPLQIGRMKAKDALYFLLDGSRKEQIEKSCDRKNTLLGYRYHQIFTVLSDGKQASKVLETHKENITRHVQRLYRVRNSIVHSAVVHDNINLFIKHLVEYVESTMSVVLHRLENSDVDTLEEVFAMARDSVDSTIEVLKSSNHLEKESYYYLLLNGAL